MIRKDQLLFSRLTKFWAGWTPYSATLMPHCPTLTRDLKGFRKRLPSALQQSHSNALKPWIHAYSVLTSGGIIPLLDGGMTTLRSGLRLPIPMFPPGGGGDLVGMTLPKPLPLGVLRRPGEPLELTKPFPAEGNGNRNTSWNYGLWLTTLAVIKQSLGTVLLCSSPRRAALSVSDPLGSFNRLR